MFGKGFAAITHSSKHAAFVVSDRMFRPASPTEVQDRAYKARKSRVEGDHQGRQHFDALALNR